MRPAAGFGATRSRAFRVNVAGLDFPNPLGMAAGYDKNGEVPDAFSALALVSPRSGRLLLCRSLATRNRASSDLPTTMPSSIGSASTIEGTSAARRGCRRGAGGAGIVGVNIGANKDSADRIADYELGVKRFAPLASYLTVNISSPNTPGLRNMQAGKELAELLSRVVAARASLDRRQIEADLSQDRARPYRKGARGCRCRGAGAFDRWGNRFEHHSVRAPA